MQIGFFEPGEMFRLDFVFSGEVGALGGDESDVAVDLAEEKAGNLDDPLEDEELAREISVFCRVLAR